MQLDNLDLDYLKTLTVLYIEDDEEVRRQFEYFLRRRCATLLTAFNGVEGLRAFRDHAPDIIITDIQMPVMDGLSMLKEIQAIDHSVPFIVTTAFEQTDYLLRSIDVGVDKYVIKPVITERLYAALLDCAHRLRVEDQLRLAAKALESSMEGIMITDAENKIISVNPAFCSITGYQPKEVVGKTPKVLSSGYQDVRFYTNMWRDLATKGCWQGEVINRCKCGRIYPEWLSITTLYDSHRQVTNRIGIFSDISERKLAEENLRNLAQHDNLTGLANRSLLMARFEMALASASRNGEQLGVLFVDLDNFKFINDSYGHGVGDGVLQEVARRLQSLFRANDTICRLGGDEFIIVQSSVGGLPDAERAAEKILDVLIPAIEIDEFSVDITSSVGIAVYPDHGSDLNTLVRNADMAMYLAKQQGKNTYRFYQS
ncbi:GGDEF domain-containing response regulator [Pelotalea chapellei]|uniref:Diguanylate cyclase n=1 Tax=Pelotalea chapellei TaxID=44671 RepID=A0ABS5U9V6_9BACT|nr:diguanylate cyclase [Pelotalea chapellei]MBT1072430.1 diguanylate cyclase [Pelotalea chapellei]